MDLKLRLKRGYRYLFVIGIVIGEFLLLAPIYPHGFRIVDRSIVLPFGLSDCEKLTWGANGWWGGGYATVDVEVNTHFSSDRLHIRIYDPFGLTYLNETDTTFHVVLPVVRLAEGYKVTVENPGTAPCDGPAISIFGQIEFWHQETVWRSLLS